LALFGHKITLYRFNQGGGHTNARGLKSEQGAEPPLAPLILTTVC